MKHYFSPAHLVDCILLVGVGHDYTMVFGSHVALNNGSVVRLLLRWPDLDPLAIGTSPLIDVLPCSVPSHEADRADIRVVADEVHRVVLTMDHVHHSVGAALESEPN